MKKTLKLSLFMILLSALAIIFLLLPWLSMIFTNNTGSNNTSSEQPHEHIAVIDEAIAPTCSSSGLTEGKHCSICNEILVKQEQIPAIGHDLIHHSGKLATRSQPGYEPYETCSRCEYSTFKKIPAIGSSGLNYYTIENNGAGKKICTVTGIGSCFDTDIIIPEILSAGYIVTEIGEKAFKNNYGFKSITIPDSVTTIGSEAFYGCNKLRIITIGNSVTSIEDRAFYGCSSLTSITIPDSVTSIGSWAFYDCSGLTSATIGNSVSSIAYSAFNSCGNLASITIPDSVTKIDGRAFFRCSSLTSVTVGNSVRSIENLAFAECTSLTSISIPNSVTKIDEDAFSGCNLKKVYFNGSAKQWQSILIINGNGSLTSATRFYYSEMKPTKYGNYWHYDENGNIKEW